jgi:hypothetical protein
MIKKVYTIRINDELPDGLNLWYRWKVGSEYPAHLAIHENSRGTDVPVFKLSVAPFFHVYPNHCTVIRERLIE